MTTTEAIQLIRETIREAPADALLRVADPGREWEWIEPGSCLTGAISGTGICESWHEVNGAPTAAEGLSKAMFWVRNGRFSRDDAAFGRWARLLARAELRRRDERLLEEVIREAGRLEPVCADPVNDIYAQEKE